MNLTEQLNIRIEHDLRKEADQVFKKLGIKTGDAIRMFLKQVCLTQSFPLELKIPNKTTLLAIDKVEQGKVEPINMDGLKKTVG